MSTKVKKKIVPNGTDDVLVIKRPGMKKLAINHRDLRLAIVVQERRDR